MRSLLLSALITFGLTSPVLAQQPSWLEIARTADGEEVVMVRPSSLRESKPNGKRSGRWNVYVRTIYKRANITDGTKQTYISYQAHCKTRMLYAKSYLATRGDGSTIRRVDTMTQAVEVEEGTIAEAIFQYACGRDR